MKFEPKAMRTYQEMNNVCCSYFVTDLGVNQAYIGLDKCNKGLATLDELCKRLIRHEEPVIKCWEKSFSPALPCEIMEISDPSIAIAVLSIDYYLL
jgi:hypothetical protein